MTTVQYMAKADIALDDLKSFFIELGWKPSRTTKKAVLLQKGIVQIMLPRHDGFTDTGLRMSQAIETLGRCEGMTEESIVKELINGT